MNTGKFIGCVFPRYTFCFCVLSLRFAAPCRCRPSLAWQAAPRVAPDWLQPVLLFVLAGSFGQLRDHMVRVDHIIRNRDLVEICQDAGSRSLLVFKNTVGSALPPRKLSSVAVSFRVCWPRGSGPVSLLPPFITVLLAPRARVATYHSRESRSLLGTSRAFLDRYSQHKEDVRASMSDLKPSGDTRQ